MEGRTHSENPSLYERAREKFREHVAREEAQPMPPQAHFSPTVLDQFILKDRIGNGSYSNVYKATRKDDAASEEAFAVKVIYDNPKKPYLRDRAKREADSMRDLSGHPNIIQLVEFIELKDRVCIVMPFIPGGTLLTYINHVNTPLPEKEVATILLQLISALELAHSHGWVHRDIKLENILRRTDGTVVLTDWGFASPWTPGKTITGSVGSPHYSAPEIVRNDSYVGPEVDVWSLGVVIYALACNRLPFSAPALSEVYNKILAGTFAHRNLSPPLLFVINSMLCTNRRMRASLVDVKLSLWMCQFHPQLRSLAKAHNTSPKIALPSSPARNNNGAAAIAKPENASVPAVSLPASPTPTAAVAVAADASTQAPSSPVALAPPTPLLLISTSATAQSPSPRDTQQDLSSPTSPHLLSTSPSSPLSARVHPSMHVSELSPSPRADPALH